VHSPPDSLNGIEFNRDPERILLGFGRTNANHFLAKFAAASGEP
jgi:hypothetical protein